MIELYLADALSTLEKAHVAGFFRDAAMREQVQTDSDLDVLRDRQEFRRITDMISRR